MLSAGGRITLRHGAKDRFREGSLIHGTHRLQDLIPTFIEEAERLGYEPTALLDLHGYLSREWAMPDDHHWWDTEEASELLDALIDVLGAAAPQNFYFGCHPGDGSDYGFWPIDWLP